MIFKSRQQYFSVSKDCEGLLKQVCPKLCHKSGIYFYTREDFDEKCAYIGKSVNCLKRCVSHHLGSKQPIDKSIKKRGYYNKDTNDLGWKLNVLYFPQNELDEKERFYIDAYKKAGYVLYNIESGGTTGKTIIGERQSPKGYFEGVAYGRAKQIKEIKVFFDKYLDFTIKGKPNKIKERKFEEFKELLGE